MPFQNNVLAGASGATGYEVPYSLRFRRSNSAYLSRTPASTGNQQIMTFSWWMKIGELPSANQVKLIFASGAAGSNPFFAIGFNDGNNAGGNAPLRMSILEGTSAVLTSLASDMLFRDPSAWYHCVVAIDTTQATSTNRVKLYVNGTQQTLGGTTTYGTSGVYPSLNANLNYNTSTYATLIGKSSYLSQYFDGYLAEMNFIDGQALTPSSFGQTDSATGVWVPKKYSGTYGNNGFYLKFADASAATATAIGKDSSGNGNNWTPSGISVTSGVTYDQMLDTPTLNYCTGNSLSRYTTNTYNFTNGNLEVEMFDSSNVQIQTRMSMGVSSGKWYWEATLVSYSIYQPSLGVAADNILNGNYVGGTALQWGVYGPNGDKYNNGVFTAYGSAATTNDVVQIALDMDNGKIWWGKNGTWFASGDPASGTNAAFTNLAGNTVLPAMGVGGTTNAGGKYAFNFGQRTFSYTPPTGFKALNTANLATPSIKKGSLYMDATLRTGTGATASVSSLGFQPDLVWIKSRSAATDHGLYDAVRGVQKQLESNTTTGETTETTGLTAFNSNGYTVGALAQLNTSAATYVDWSWRETLTAGFDIMTYTGNGVSGRTVSHGLGVTPALIVVKNRSTAGAFWSVAHKSLTAGYNLLLNDTTGQFLPGNAAYGGISAFNSSTFTVVTGLTDQRNVNTNGDSYVAYLWSEIEGFSKFGSYTGNGSTDGPFVWCGHRPRWLMIKRTDTTNDWEIVDTARGAYNVNTAVLAANSSSAESAFTSGYELDVLSNGFKLRSTGVVHNASGGTYIFAAFAENPFKYARAR